ncbi:UNVERIFIED_CONTAM: hypothetical protein GTU68_049371 [Idotea baltica]|nr:hypothetical protein [Idotea baltica]
MKKILVPLKRVPDYQMKVKINSSSDGIVTDNIKWILNPFDEIAVEEAIRLRDSLGEVEITVACIGPESSSEQVRTALAMGADKAIIVQTDDYVDSHVASEAIAALYARDEYALILMGKQAIDSDASQTGQLLASKLNIAQATFASKLVVNSDSNTAEVTREVDGGLETISISLPAVVTTDLRLNEPRYPSLPGIVKSKKKPLEIIPIADLGVDVTPRVRVTKMEFPAARAAGIKVDSVDALIEKLQNEAKVI